MEQQAHRAQAALLCATADLGSGGAGAEDGSREESSGYEAGSQEASGDDEATLDEEEVSDWGSR